MRSEVEDNALEVLFRNRQARYAARLSEASARCMSAMARDSQERAMWDAVADEASAEVIRLLAEDAAAREVLDLA